MKTFIRVLFGLAFILSLVSGVQASPHFGANYPCPILYDENYFSKSSIGFNQDRLVISWAQLESEKGVIVIPDQLGTCLERVISSGYEPVLTICCDNSLYQSESIPLTEVVSAFNRVLHELMVKYQGKVHYWELIPASINNDSQNEIGRYEAFVASASKMLKENDSKNIVLAGGCLDKKWNCIQLLKNSNFLKHVDILTLDIKQGDASASIRELRWLMNIQGGKDKPIWVTHLDPGRLGLTPPFYQTIVRCIGAGVDNVFINKRYLWSFLLSDLSLLRNGLDQVVPSQSFRFGAGGFAQTFHTADGLTTALWVKEGLQTITLKVGSDPIEVFYLFSDRSEILYPVDGLISITLTPLPIYLRGEDELSVKSIVPHNLFSALRLPPKNRSEKPAYIVTIDNTSLISLIGDIIIGHLKGKPVMQSFRVPPQSIQPVRFYLPEFPLLCKDSSVRFKVQVDGRTAAMLEVKSPETIVHLE